MGVFMLEILNAYEKIFSRMEKHEWEKKKKWIVIFFVEKGGRGGFEGAAYSVLFCRWIGVFLFSENFNDYSWRLIKI